MSNCMPKSYCIAMALIIAQHVKYGGFEGMGTAISLAFFWRNNWEACAMFRDTHFDTNLDIVSVSKWGFLENF